MTYDVFMEVINMKNNRLKLLTNNKEVRLYIVDVTDLLEYSNIKEVKQILQRGFIQRYLRVAAYCVGF